MNQQEARYCEQLLRAQSEHNRFSFRRDYVTSKLMTKMEALFVQDLINRVTMKNSKRKPIEEDGRIRYYSLCTEEFLVNSLDWDHNIQNRMFRTLQSKGFVRVRHLGMPQRRYIWINIVKIEDSVDKCTESNDDEQKSSNDEPGASSNDDSSIVYEEVRRKNNARPAKRTSSEREDFVLGSVRPPSQGEQLAQALYGLLLKHSKVVPRDYRDRQWSSRFTKAIQDHGLPKVRQAFAAYEKHFGEKFMVKVYAANTFCENIVRILDLAQQIEEGNRPRTKSVYVKSEKVPDGNGHFGWKSVYRDVPLDY